ncbi:RILP-like protein 2 [Anolis carolinensis]|uniref:RILP-like protein 2 n=1 Tax=Anolis carolinensis TaxID=28377 RepID=UPI002F2B843E
MEADGRPEQEEEGEGGRPGGLGADPERALAKSAFQLTAEDVYDLAYVLGRELHQLSAEPRAQVPARVAQLQFKVVGVLEMLEALVEDNNLALEALRLERDSLRRQLDESRAHSQGQGPQQVNLGPDKMVIDLTDANRPRFTLQELREVLQERNQLKAQLLVAQEELQCYKSGFISQKQDWVEPTEASGPSKGREEKAIIRRLFNF